MNHKTSFNLAFISRIVMALVFLFVALPVASARSPESVRVVETTQDAFSAAASVPGVRFVHTATAANTVTNHTFINHPLANNNPNAILFVTQNYNPGGVGGTYNNHSIGVWYSVIEQNWGIFNQDGDDMPVGADFNVLIPATNTDVFVHIAWFQSIVGNHTFIDHPLTNDNPNAILLVTQNLSPEEPLGGAYNNHPIGVYYSNSAQQWAVFNQDHADMERKAAFNVLVLATGAEVFVHTATAGNIASNYTYIDHPLSNNNHNAIVFVTQNWNPGGGLSGVYNDHPIGVFYSDSMQQWAIFNQDAGDMPIGAGFNVLIPTTDPAAFVHTATADNTSGNLTFINHPLTNENRNAILFVTQNWNPGGGVFGVYNNNPIGVYYSSTTQQWAIFNQDSTTNIPIGAAFNVLIPNVDSSVFVHKVTEANAGGARSSIDHPITNDNPTARLFITPNWNPGGVGGTYNNQPTGVVYLPGGKWAIFNQDTDVDIPVGAAFNVLVSSQDAPEFVHVASSANTIENVTHIFHLLTNNNPNAIVLVTLYKNFFGVSNDNPIGVFYSIWEHKWGIFNQDTSANMPDGAAYFFLVVFNKSYLPIILR